MASLHDRRRVLLAQVESGKHEGEHEIAAQPILQGCLPYRNAPDEVAKVRPLIQDDVVDELRYLKNRCRHCESKAGRTKIFQQLQK